MFKIGEFSKLTQISIRMLRHYDEMGLLKPEHIDKSSGYRYYSANQIPQLQKIVLLRDLDFTVKEIKEGLLYWDSDEITKLLDAKKATIADKIEIEKKRYEKIDAALSDISTDKLDAHCNIIMKSVPAFDCLSLRRTIPNYYCEGQLWQELEQYVHENHIPVQSNGVTFFYDVDHKESDVDVEICVFTDVMGSDDGCFKYRHEPKADKMACVMIYGSYDNIGKGYEAFAMWLDNHKPYKMLTPTRQICHIGPMDTDDPNQYLTELQIPVI